MASTAPIFLRFAPHRRRCQVLDLDPTASNGQSGTSSRSVCSQCPHNRVCRPADRRSRRHRRNCSLIEMPGRGAPTSHASVRLHCSIGAASLRRQAPAGRKRRARRCGRGAFRIMARRNAKGVKLYTRNGHDFSQRFPLVAAAIMALPVRPPGLPLERQPWLASVWRR